MNNRSNGNILAVTGIDTGVGKTVVTGMIARSLLNEGFAVFTQKLVQTGCVNISEDILEHRRLMKISPVREDFDGLSCPYLFADPCSPHLAAEMAGEQIDVAKISAATEILSRRYDILLVEGAGGLSVPLTSDYTFLDYVMERKYPVVLVSSPRLGSLNHTLNALELLWRRNVQLAAIIYNLHGVENTIAAMIDDSRRIMLRYLEKFQMEAEVIDLASFPLMSKGFQAAVLRMLCRVGENIG